MSLVVAVPFGIASAVVYGSSIVLQHRTAQLHAGEDGESASGLLKMLRHPVFLMAIGGDFIGFLLQITALATGPVVVIQPLVVLMLPVALLVGWLTGGHRPTRGDFLGSVGIIAGLGTFLGLIGEPAASHVPQARTVGFAVIVVVVAGSLFCLAVAGRGRILRGAMYGAVAGVFFGTLAVMIDAASDRVAKHGFHGLVAHPRGLTLLACAALVGIPAMILTQMSFQVGALAATLPANLATDPLTGVVLGAILLREHIPMSTGHVLAYLVCLGVVLAGTIRLAAPATAGHAPAPPTDDGLDASAGSAAPDTAATSDPGGVRD